MSDKHNISLKRNLPSPTSMENYGNYVTMLLLELEEEVRAIAERNGDPPTENVENLSENHQHLHHQLQQMEMQMQEEILTLAAMMKAVDEGERSLTRELAELRNSPCDL